MFSSNTWLLYLQWTSVVQYSHIHYLSQIFWITCCNFYISIGHCSDGKEYACNTVECGLIPGWERYPGEGNGNPHQYSYLENPMDRGAWQTTVQEVVKSGAHWAANTSFHFTCIFMLWRGFLPFNFMTQPLLAWNFSSAVASPLSALIECKRVKVLKYIRH